MKTSTKKRKLKSLEVFEDCASNRFLMRREHTIKANNDKLVSLGLPPMISLIAQPTRLPSSARFRIPAPTPTVPQCELRYANRSLEGVASASHSTPTILVSGSELRHTNRSLGGGSLVEIPTYEQIFWPPSQRFKEPRKLYGKAVLRKFFYSQYLTLMTNKRIMKEWLVDGGLFDNPPNLKDRVGATHLRELIDAKESNLAALKFGSITYRMLPRDIYETLKEMLHYAKRKLCQDVHRDVGDQNVQKLVPSQEPFDKTETEMQDYNEEEAQHSIIEQQVLLVSSDLEPTLRASKQIRGRKSKAPPPLEHSKMVLPLSTVEKLIMESVGYDDVDDMYSKIRVFMKQENILGKKNIFTNINGMTNEEAVRSVGKFLMHG